MALWPLRMRIHFTFASENSDVECALCEIVLAFCYVKIYHSHTHVECKNLKCSKHCTVVEAQLFVDDHWLLLGSWLCVHPEERENDYCHNCAFGNLITVGTTQT